MDQPGVDHGGNHGQSEDEFENFSNISFDFVQNLNVENGHKQSKDKDLMND